VKVRRKEKNCQKLLMKFFKNVLISAEQLSEQNWKLLVSPDISGI
jgi:hypothetical protein